MMAAQGIVDMLSHYGMTAGRFRHDDGLTTIKAARRQRVDDDVTTAAHARVFRGLFTPWLSDTLL